MVRLAGFDSLRGSTKLLMSLKNKKQIKKTLWCIGEPYKKMKSIIETIREKGSKFYPYQLVAIKNSKSCGQLAPGLSAVIVNNKLQGFLWRIEETTYNRYGGSNSWDVIYSAILPQYSFVEEDSDTINKLYMGENESPIAINLGRRSGVDYKYVLVDNWERPTKFRLVQIQEQYIPLVYSLVPDLTIHRWDGKTIYRDIFVPKQVLYPYAGDNEPVLCCTHDPLLGYISAYWDGECVYWKSNQDHICGLGWCFLPKSKEELINKIDSKEEIKEPVEDEEASDEERPRRRRRN